MARAVHFMQYGVQLDHGLEALGAEYAGHHACTICIICKAGCSDIVATIDMQ